MGDIHRYLIDTKGAHTKEKLRVYKSLDVYNYFISECVQIVYHLYRAGHDILNAKVNHSQRLSNKNHEVWLLLEHNGTVVTGHYACMAE